MTANAFALGSVLMKSESSWGETTATFSSPIRLAVQKVDVTGLTHEKIDSARVTQYRGEGTEHIPGVMGGSFVLRGWLHGHGSTTSGATALTDLGTFLGWMLGSSAVSAASGTTTTGGTATAPTTTASGTFSAGSLCRIGALGDGRGNGQFAAISTHVTTTLTLLTGLTAAPNNGDVLYSAETIYNDPTVSTVSASYRFWISSADQRYIAHGCFPMSLSITQTDPGAVPMWEATIGVSWWEPEATVTFPTTNTYDSGSGPFNPAPNAAGSLFFAAHGTATRATLDIRAWSINIGLGISPIMGPNGVNAYQAVTGVRRTPDQITVSLTVDAQDATASPTHATNWLAGGKYHMLYTLNSGIGTAVGIYLPCIRYAGAKPTQADMNGRNSTPVSFVAYANESVTTSALTLSSIRIGLA